MDQSVFVFSDKVYIRLKWLVTIVLPAISTFYITVGELLGLPHTLTVAGVIAALGTFLGALIGLSSRNYDRIEQPTDGIMAYEELADGIDLTFTTAASMADLIKSDKITFSVVPKVPLE